MSETTDPIAIIPDPCPVCGERTCAVHLRPVSDPPRWFVKATSAMSLLLYGDPAKVDRVACAETIMNTLTAAALQAPAEVSRIEAACQERERHPLRVVTADDVPEAPPGFAPLTPGKVTAHPTQAIPSAWLQREAREGIRSAVPPRAVEAAEHPAQAIARDITTGLGLPAEMAPTFGFGPGVAKVEPLTAFERLEAAIDLLRQWFDEDDVTAPIERIGDAVEAFGAWKVARAADPPSHGRERTPAPLTEAEAIVRAMPARYMTREEANNDYDGLHGPDLWFEGYACALREAAALLAASCGDIPAAVRTLPLPGVEQPAAAIPRTLTREEAHALLVRGMGHSEDVAAGLLRNARTILAKGHAGDPDMPITELHAPLLHAALRAYVAWLDAQPEGLGPEPGMPKA